jgi:hypothetical protein
MNLPDGWRPISRRTAPDGSTVVLAERMEPVDLGPKRSLFQRFGILRVTADDVVILEANWEDRAGAMALFDQATT